LPEAPKAAFAKRSVRDLVLEPGQRVLARVDFNVPLAEGRVGDDSRIRAALPTIELLLDREARLILCSHLDRPQGRDPKTSLKPASERLGELIDAPVHQAPEVVGPQVRRGAERLRPVQVLVLENTRWERGETRNDPELARELGSLAEVYVNDAFGAAHRAHASVEAIVRLLPEAGAGLLMERELRYLGEALGNPERPFVAVLGGAKVSDKIEVIENLLSRVDRLLIGGAMAYTFFKAQGLPVGKSLVEDDKLDAARDILARAKDRRIKLLLPVDHVVAEKLEAGLPMDTLKVDDAKIGNRMGLDIGPATVAAYTEALRDAKTVVWNGPMGVFEIDAFAKGTIAVARAVAEVKGTTIVGGGDSISAVKKAGVADRITHISTGGGASLEFLGGQILPGVAVLPEA
jgi:phosphoglycerate kinase